MSVLNDDQIKCVAHIESEVVRWSRLAVRCKEIGMPVLAISCKDVSDMLKDTLQLQCKMLLHPEKNLGVDWLEK